MCGIVGVVNLNNQSIDSHLIKKLIRSVSHRGPDGEGTLVEGSVGLGHSRLSILDLSPDGAQPMTRGQGRYSVTFNGEIYNYLEIRDELQKHGHRFQTRTDTEVLLAAFAEWGDACVLRFNGMWSFAIYDRVEERLFCSRDRFGKKPFYYLHNRDWFAFGSEIRQLLPLLSARHANVHTLLKFIVGAQAEGVERSFFEGINKLPGGHNLSFNLRNGDMRIDRYYELLVDSSLAGIDYEEAEQRFSALLEDAVHLRMRSDVRVGTSLSGGLDSSSIATIAASFYRNVTGQPFAAITACSEQNENDESNFAAQVVQHSHLLWHKVKPSYDDFAAAMPAVVEAQEEPFGSASIVMQHFVMRCAREHGIPVLLDGQGGDETLLGYERYFAAHYLNEARNHGWLRAIGAMRASSINNAMMSAHRIIAYFAYFNFSQVRWFNYLRRHRYLREQPEMFDEFRLYAEASGDIQALQKLEIERTTLPALLRYEDKNAMWHSVETRLPFLDHRLVQLSLSLPGSSKISQGWTKHVLRRVMAGRMPDNIVWRRNKFGFEAPERLWFGRHRSTMLEAVRTSELLRSVCSHDKLLREFAALDALTQWRLYSVACWERTFEVEA